MGIPFLVDKLHKTSLTAKCMSVNIGSHSQLCSFIDFD